MANATALSPEIAARLRSEMFALENLLLDAGRAADALYGFSLAYIENTIPPELAEAGFVHFGVDLSARLKDLHQRYRALFSLAVRGVLPENDDGEGRVHD